MSDRHDAVIQQYLELVDEKGWPWWKGILAAPFVFFMWALVAYVLWHRERRKKKLECPECGDLRADLVPHGVTCLNKNCGRYRIAY